MYKASAAFQETLTRARAPALKSEKATFQDSPSHAADIFPNKATPQAIANQIIALLCFWGSSIKTSPQLLSGEAPDLF